MVNRREICVTNDPYAYDATEIDNYAIVDGYSPANDWITYQDAGHAHTNAFKTLRVTSQDERVSRDTIVEESTDQVAAASLFGGTISLIGGFSGAWRGYDFHGSGLLLGIMGWQTPATIANPATGFSAGYRYEFAMAPATLALKYVDEQANANGGVTRIYRGVGITQANISLRAKQYVTMDSQWMARRVEVFDSPYPSETEPTGDPAMFYNAVLKWTPEGGSEETFKCQEFTMNVNRPIDTDDFMIGSQFLNSLTYNGLTDLGGNITLSPSDWDKLRAMMAGTTDDTKNTLDDGKREFFGTVTNTTTSTVLANAIPSGQLVIMLHKPDGTQVVGRITAMSCKLTEASASAQGRQKYTKTVNWRAVINNTSKFYIDVWQPA